jgi:protein involved in polysaccharide export with SLBB domain
MPAICNLLVLPFPEPFPQNHHAVQKNIRKMFQNSFNLTQNKRTIFFCSLVAILFLLHNCASAQISRTEVPIETESIEKSNEEDLVHFGDLIDVDIVGSVDYDWRGTVNPEGFLSGINFVENPVNAICKTEKEIALEVAESYKKILRDPVIDVKILDRSNRPLTVLNGAIKIPQRFLIKRPVMLNELIISSGGLTDKVSGDIQIFRPRYLNCLSKINRETAVNNSVNSDGGKFIDVKMSGDSEFINVQIENLLSGKKEANPQILSGDVIMVAEAELIYIIGGVVNPTNISSRSVISLTRAIDSAGGLTKDADEQKITIYRNNKEKSEVIEIDLTKIKSNQAEDILLKPLDIVEVGQKGREKRKTLPKVRSIDQNKRNTGNLPIKVIN